MIIRGDLFKEYDALVDIKRFIENALNFCLVRKSRNRSCSILITARLIRKKNINFLTLRTRKDGQKVLNGELRRYNRLLKTVRVNLLGLINRFMKKSSEHHKSKAVYFNNALIKRSRDLRGSKQCCQQTTVQLINQRSRNDSWNESAIYLNGVLAFFALFPIRA